MNQPQLPNMGEREIWRNPKYRCNNKNASNYHLYGGRGIRICESWLESFDNFYKDMGPRPYRQHSVERRNTNGNYEPDNCYWATKKQQARNKRDNRLITYNGKTQTMIEWSEELGIDYNLLSSRINDRKWSVERALIEPVHNYNIDIEIDGSTKSLKEWLLIYNISYKLYYSRINNGVDVKKAITTPHKTKQITYNNKTMSLKQWSKELNIGYRLLIYRFRQGWSVEMAFTTPVKVYNKND